MKHEKFHYKSLEEIKAKCKELGIDIPFARDTKILGEPLKIKNITLHNRLGIAPMEGADSTPDGRPTDYTERRYTNEAVGGVAVIWYEAISIVEEGRSSKTQLLLTEKTLDDFKQMNEKVKEAGLKANGFYPYLVMQANHSGRYSNPDNKPSPLIAQRNAWLESFRAANDDCIVSDDYLKQLEEKFGKSALLAKKAGFDAVDIKSCHGYLFQEVIAAYDRPGEYGGSYENRARLLKNSIKAAKAYEDDTFMITSRIGIYDGYPSGSIGFGQRADGSIDLTEPKRLIKELHEDLGLSLVNITMGNPYATTHVTRPFDAGKYPPDEHPFEGLYRILIGTHEIKKTVPDMAVLGSAPTYLREYADLYAAGAVEQGVCDGFLFGRMAFADPDFANEIVKKGRIDPKRVCLTCGKCGDLIRSHKPTGCVIRDSKTYMPFYKEFIEEKKSLPSNFRG
ncbi:flavin oxidoreductase/NADH oxidase [Treponema parvum]|uniref:Flavin oxidoreductase/NADH oxidase n=1 Tax=Treponema parvum TaxID=138851 RepID=A0A975F1Z1_9SPIR|nr:hypothetical protein [Treponema parvum]QTQ12624.1 flavin oxidoreductase/NADH oxidase [Treponema parvum]